MSITKTLISNFNKVRQRTESICAPLEKEDYAIQPTEDVSPPKWHLGHTTWFFEQFILVQYVEDYQVFNKEFSFIFNSYYETLGERILRTDRGNLSRPTVDEVYAYRKYVDEIMEQHLPALSCDEIENILTIGLNHEEQHQELLITDIKYILGHNPLLPSYGYFKAHLPIEENEEWVQMKRGQYDIGFKGDTFCYDNELNPHTVFIEEYAIRNTLVSNQEYLAFVENGGYQKFDLWHSEGWDWVQKNENKSPMYWHKLNGKWNHYTLEGLQELDLNAPVTHINYFEAFAFAQWAGHRLPTEFEWEAANQQFKWGQCWEWTESAYLPYPGYKKPDGALGEYNGKFMVNQKVLRGASVATSPSHSRSTYRNFFQPHLRWQYTGIRLAK
jgi:ergothioneine biosynthesis protein EgtB